MEEVRGEACLRKYLRYEMWAELRRWEWPIPVSCPLCFKLPKEIWINGGIACLVLFSYMFLSCHLQTFLCVC